MKLTMKFNMGTTAYTNFIELVNNRYSCRDYSATPLSKEIIEQVMLAAQLAPSACNKQPWKFIIVTSAEKRAQIHECYPRE